VRGRRGVSACRKGSDVTLDSDLGSIGIRSSRSSIRADSVFTPTRPYADTPCRLLLGKEEEKNCDHEINGEQLRAFEPIAFTVSAD
jgi:hypothetical protein